MENITENETLSLILRVGGAFLTLGSAIGVLLVGRELRSKRLMRVLWALVAFFGSFAVLRGVSPFVEPFYMLVAANLLFLLLNIALFVQRSRLRRAAPTVELKTERADALDEAINFLLATKKETPQ